MSSNKGYYPNLFKFLGLRARLPKTPLGKYKSVSSFKYRIPNGPECQIFYPASPPANQSERVRKIYTRPQVTKGLAEFGESNKAFLSGVHNIKHHVYHALPLDTDFISNEGKNCSIIFSHGVAANNEIYSILCKDLASQGYYVFALEHEDGSGSYARTVDGKDVFLEPVVPNKVPEHMTLHEAVVAHRKPSLDKRLSEIATVFNFITSGEFDDDTTKESKVLSTIIKYIDPNRVTIAGHSYGAATAVLAAQQRYGDRVSRFNCAIILDIWSAPLSPNAITNGIAIPTLSLLSEQFLERDFIPLTKELLQSCPTKYSYYLKNTVHQDFADTPFYGPAILTRKFGMGGYGGRKRTQKLLVDICTAFLDRHCKSNNAEKMKEEHIIPIGEKEMVVNFD